MFFLGPTTLTVPAHVIVPKKPKRKRQLTPIQKFLRERTRPGKGTIVPVDLFIDAFLRWVGPRAALAYSRNRVLREMHRVSTAHVDGAQCFVDIWLLGVAA